MKVVAGFLLLCLVSLQGTSAAPAPGNHGSFNGNNAGGGSFNNNGNAGLNSGSFNGNNAGPESFNGNGVSSRDLKGTHDFPGSLDYAFKWVAQLGLKGAQKDDTTDIQMPSTLLPAQGMHLSALYFTLE
ncbi:hypothetical protein lerEdw1_009596 [Lerista edwardsae]|nr:hypothetical protein lerEdw1_009596 [Lerista edwardsae]